MKIGIIGLLPEQTNHVRLKFPNYAIEFLPREREREAAAFAQRHSKVVLMTKFISHSTQNAVPMHKRVHINGGTTQLNNWLVKQASEVTVTHHPKPAVKETEVMAPATEKPTDWSSLKTLAIGETFTVKRPKQTPLTKFENNVNTQRSYYNRKHGIKTSVSFGDGFAIVTVVDRETKVVSAAEVISNVAGQIVDHVSAQAGVREFWQDVYVARARLGLPNELCADDADAALAVLKKRFF